MRDSDVETMCKYRISRSVFPLAHAFLTVFNRAFYRAPRCADRCASQPQLALDRGACEKTTVRGSLWPARGFPSI